MKKIFAPIGLLLALAMLFAACNAQTAANTTDTSSQASSDTVTEETAEQTETTDEAETTNEETEPVTTGEETTAPHTTEPQTTEPQTTEPQTTEPQTTEPETTVEIPPASEGGLDTPDGAFVVNGIVIDGTRAMEQFSGTEKSGQGCASLLNEFKKAVGEGVNVYAMPAPTSGAIYAPDSYPITVSRTARCFTGLKDALEGVIYVDALNNLKAHRDEYIYFRTDHHWTALGAYYACQQLAKVADLPFAELDNFAENPIAPFVGSMYGYTDGLAVLENNPDTLICYEPMQEYSCDYYSRDDFEFKFSGTLFGSNESYTRFIYGDSYTVHIKTGVENGRRLIVFKDSYGNALAPFLISSFEEVYIADMRYFDLNAAEFISEHGITDVCFTMSSFSVAGGNRDNITRLIEN